VRILFVCMGNICRSPTAEGVLRRLVAAEGLADVVEIDSAGTIAHHVGESPDPRSTQAAARRGTVLEGAARQVADADFGDYDLLLAMDAENLAELRRRARPTSIPRGSGCCASSTRPPWPRATSTCPTRTTAVRAASTTCST
jgi:protein-tyrosine phosphatase